MDMFLFVVGFLSLIGFFVVLIMNLFKKKSLKKAGIGMLVGFVLMIIGISFNTTTITDADKTKENDQVKVEEQVTVQKQEPTNQAEQVVETTKEDKEKQEEKPEPVIPGTLGMTPEEFKTAFNNAANEFESNLKIGNMEVKTGDIQDVFQYTFNDLTGVIGTINKADGSLRDVTIIAQGDGTSESVLNIVMSIGQVIVATNPDLTPDERGDILRELGLFDENLDINNLDNTTTRNGIEYQITGSDLIGIMFSASDENDE